MMLLCLGNLLVKLFLNFAQQPLHVIVYKIKYFSFKFSAHTGFNLAD